MSSTVCIIWAINSLSSGLQGAKVTPQLPIRTDVTPWQLTGFNSLSHPICASKWVCMSTNPGLITNPLAFTSSFPWESTFPISEIVLFLMAKSP